MAAAQRTAVEQVTPPRSANAPKVVRRPPPRLPRPTAAPLPRHPLRSGASLLAIVALVGLLVAVAVGGTAVALGLALRAAVS